MADNSCNVTDRDFKFWMPVEITKGKDGEMRIGGVAHDENAEDLQGEKVFTDGLDISYLLKRGSFNWDHSKSPGDILGEIDKAEKINGQLHVGGILYPTKEAKNVYNLMRSMKDVGSKRRLGLSIEGKVKERDTETGKQIKKAWLKNIAITNNPINSGTYIDVIKSFGNFEFVPCNKNCSNCTACTISKSLESKETKGCLLSADKEVIDLANSVETPRKRIAKSESIVSLGNQSYRLISTTESDDNTTSITQTIQKADPPEKDIKQDQKVYDYIGITPDQRQSNSTDTEEGETPSDEQFNGKWKIEEADRVDKIGVKKGLEAVAEIAAKVGEVAGKVGEAVGKVGEAAGSSISGTDAPVESAPAEVSSAANDEDTEKASPADEGAILDDTEKEEREEEDENRNEDNPDNPEEVVKAEGEGGSPSGVGLHAGVDNPATSGGISGSALRKESLEEDEKVITYKLDKEKKLGKSDVIGILRNTYSESVAKALTDLVFLLNNERKTMIQLLKSDRVAEQMVELLKAIQVKGYVRANRGKLVRVNTYSKDIAHEAMRLHTMGLGALLTRVRKISHPDKLLHFYAASKVMGFDDVLPKAIAKRGIELGLRPSDFENVHKQAQMHIRNLTYRDVDEAYSRTHKPKSATA